MRFVFKAEWNSDSGIYVSSWVADGASGFIVTDGATKAALESRVQEAIETYLATSGAENKPFTFEILYISR